MDNIQLFDAEQRFIAIIWELEPINSTELVSVCLNRLGWKKSTTYTVLRKLCQRGILKNEDATVTAFIKKTDILKQQSTNIVEKNFDGSLPKFVTTFLGGRKLSEKEADELKRIIDEASK